VCGYAVNITKMGYSEPRPYMILPPPAINVYGCSAEYGNPSGHALWAAAFHFFVFLDFCHASNSPIRSNLFYGLGLFFTVFFMFIIGFARFYEGVHSINQILYGWTIGLWIAFYLHFCFRDNIINHVERVLLTKNTDKISFPMLSIVCGVLGALAFGT
jgi:membrane-associated phospholipid phosphatase